jgi:small subunit ribosomal protein S11
MTYAWGQGSKFDRTKEGIVHINSTLNNTFCVLTDKEGAVKAWTSGGTVGHKNSAKSTPIAAEKAAKNLAQKAFELGYSTVLVKLKGRGTNKQFAAAALAANGLTVTALQDVTPIPYNGCRLPRRRRL